MQNDSLKTQFYSTSINELPTLLDRLQQQSLIYPYELTYLQRQVDVWQSLSPQEPQKFPAVYKDIILLPHGDKIELIIDRSQHKLDYVTLLPSRVTLFQQLDDWYRNDPGANVALFILELDNFSNVNDVAGHATGDLILFEVARRLEKLALDNSTVVRLHGDEFGVAVKGLADVKAIWQLTRELEGVFAPPFKAAQNEYYITPSQGVSVYPHFAKSPNELIKTAYVALNQAKDDPLESAKLYQNTFDQSLKDSVILETELNDALKSRQGLEVWYQPKQHLLDNSGAGLEALVRWRHPKLGLVSPAAFIPLAEKTGLICEITNFVLEQVCKELPQLRAMGAAGRVSINLSAKDFIRKTILQDIDNILAGHQISPQEIELEITEGAFIADFDKCYRLITAFQQRGFTVSIDDFGTGYSSLSYLRKLPVNVLKIDMSFVREIETSNQARAMYQALIDIAKALKLEVVAEGVDNDAQKITLKAIGCDKIQGYLLSPPKPVSELEPILAGLHLLTSKKG